MYEEKELNLRIRQVRRHFSISREEFSRSLCVSYQDLKDVECNEAIPSDCMLELISLKYGISREWIQHGTGEMLEEDNTAIFTQLSNLRCLSPRKGRRIAQSIKRIQRELDYITRLLPDKAFKNKEENTYESND